MADRGSGAGRDSLVARLRRAKPTGLIAVARDGEETPVALSGQRGRYERAARTLVSLKAVEARCIDDGGAISEVLDVDGSGQLEDGGGTPQLGGRSAELTTLLNIVLRAQDAAVARQADLMERVTDTAIAMMRVSADRVIALDRIFTADARKREQQIADAQDQLAADMARLPVPADDTTAENAADKMLSTVLDLAQQGMTMGRKPPAKPPDNSAS